MGMKASRYNVLVNHDDTGVMILFNTLYGSLTTWEKDEVPLLTSLLENPALLQTADSPISAVLLEQKYIVKDNVDEIEIVRNRKRAGIQDKNRLDVIIMPTLDCNFACPYCYEEHYPSMMADETVTAVKKWLTAEIPKHKVLLLNWFGGEPLMGYSQVIAISRHAVAVARATGVSHIINMTTNGYLLSPGRIARLIDAEIYGYQITLDGPPETHNKLRVLKNGKGTFEKVYRNIVRLARTHEKVRISIRINFNHSNLHLVPQLLEMFPEDVRSRLRVALEPIFGECALSATKNIHPANISESLAKYCVQAERMGYNTAHGYNQAKTGKLVYCYAERENQYVINFNGDVFKCSVSKFNSENRVGYIADDGSFVRHDAQWETYVNSRLFEESCCACVYLPLCMGGCRTTRLKRGTTGSQCSLVPTNASFLLKEIALGGFAKMLQEQSQPNASG